MFLCFSDPYVRVQTDEVSNLNIKRDGILFITPTSSTTKNESFLSESPLGSRTEVYEFTRTHGFSRLYVIEVSYFVSGS